MWYNGEMVSAISASLTGLQTASKQVAEASNRIANYTTAGSNVDLAEEAVKLKLAQVQYEASLKTLETSQELSEELLRIFDEKV